MNRLCEEDINFMMKFVESKVELFFRFSHQKRLPEQIFRGKGTKIRTIEIKAQAQNFH